jgi:membrane protease YdiL (CAAX protease family)
MAVPHPTPALAPDLPLRPSAWRAAGQALLIAAVVVIGGETFGHGIVTWAEKLGWDSDLLLLKTVQPALVAAYQFALVCAIANWLGGPRRWAIVAAGPAQLTAAGWVGVVLGLYALKAAATIGFVALSGGPPASEPGGVVPSIAPLGALMRSHVWIWLVVAGVVAAIVEEVLWRGWVSRTLEDSPLGFWIGATIAASAWALLHVYYPWTIQASLVVVGIGLSWVRARTGSIWPGTLWHVMNNVVALIALRVLT